MDGFSTQKLVLMRRGYNIKIPAVGAVKAIRGGVTRLSINERKPRAGYSGMVWSIETTKGDFPPLKFNYLGGWC